MVNDPTARAVLEGGAESIDLMELGDLLDARDRVLAEFDDTLEQVISGCSELADAIAAAEFEFAEGTRDGLAPAGDAR